ncbi:MAG: response regulator [Alphaproteobacteria bacterium]|nr:response regulator [Alphaproteobacteria bacterium]
MPEGRERSAYYDFRNISALVVDDNRHVLQLVGGILESFGFGAVYKVTDVEGALKVLRQAHVDLIITDWAMEPVDGIELVRRVRQDSGVCDPKMPIIMLTGHTEMERVIEARDAGVTDFMAKPITPQAIYDRIASLIENPGTSVKDRR